MTETIDPFLGDLSKFKGRYRSQTVRLKNWDYSSPASYLVTVCTRGRLHWFGEIQDGSMHLSDIGKIVAEEWQRTSEVRKNIRLDAFVVMPDHFHAILEIQNRFVVEPSRRDGSTNERRFKLSPNTLGSMIGQFKSMSTKRIRLLHPDFSWQPRFHDHIIRSRKELGNARAYIRTNPQTWVEDPDRDYSILTF